MSSLVRIIREIHRRSLWQVLAMYLAGSWVAIQVVNQLTQTAGLPDWVPPFALVLLVLGGTGNPNALRGGKGKVGRGFWLCKQPEIG